MMFDQAAVAGVGEKSADVCCGHEKTANWRKGVAQRGRGSSPSTILKSPSQPSFSKENLCDLRIERVDNL